MSGPGERQSPRGAGSEENIRLGGRSNSNTFASPLQLLLPRLEGVLKTGGGYRACCPSCGGKSRKLSITEGDNGTLLMTCFSCHDTSAVLAAVGMVMGDLFVKRDLRTMTPADRHRLRQAALIPRWKASLEVLHHEATVLLIAANKLGDGDALTIDELTRMRVSALRVFDCGEVLNNGR